MESHYVANVRIIRETLQGIRNKIWYNLVEKLQQVWEETLKTVNFDEKSTVNNRIYFGKIYYQKWIIYYLALKLHTRTDQFAATKILEQIKTVA